MAKSKQKRLKTVAKNVKDLSPNPANAKRHPRSQIDKLKAILKMVGQETPLVVDKNNIIRKGNGTFIAIRELVAEEHPKFKDGMVDVLVTNLTGSDLATWEIADNRLSELGQWDESALARSLDALDEENIDLELTGFTEDEVDDLLANLEVETQGAVEAAEDLEEEEVSTGGRFSSSPEEEEEESEIAYSDEEIGRTPADKADTYEQSAIRQVVLLFSTDEFKEVQTLLKKVRDEQKFTDNSAAVFHLLRQYGNTESSGAASEATGA